MNKKINYLNYRLSLMMFLQFFIWGSWFVTLGTFLSNNFSVTGSQIGLAFSSQSWGAIVAPFIIGLIADRFFNAERILGVLHLIGAVLMYYLYLSQGYGKFLPVLFVYMILYMPTLGLANSITFRAVQDPTGQFSKIRVWGTVGWIVAGLVISYLFSWDSQQAIADGELKYTFLMCSACSLLMGLFSFTLPRTPPIAAETKKISDILGLNALSLFRNRNFLVFFMSSILISVPLAFYYQNANPFLTESGVSNATGKMTLGQMSEVLFMLCVPIFLVKFGIKYSLLIGMFAWVLRYLLFAYGSPDGMAPLLLLGIALHGICYDFFFVCGQIYTDSKAGVEYRSAAQGMITMATYGVGMLVGFWVAGSVTDIFAHGTVHSWREIWIVPAGLALLVSILFGLLFRKEDMTSESDVATNIAQNPLTTVSENG